MNADDVLLQKIDCPLQSANIPTVHIVSTIRQAIVNVRMIALWRCIFNAVFFISACLCVSRLDARFCVTWSEDSAIRCVITVFLQSLLNLGKLSLSNFSFSVCLCFL